MKSSSALVFQIATVILGIVAIAILLWEPHLEGRNAHATMFEIYFKDPFLAYVYVASVPFFVAIYRAFALFGHVRKKGSFSQVTLHGLRTIKQCAVFMIGFAALGAAIIIRYGDGEDRPAGVFMTFLVILGAVVIATTATLFARRLQRTLSPAAPGRG